MRIRSSSDSGSVIGSLIVTIILWMAMAFGAFFIKPFDMQKEPEYVEISITLSDFPSLETGEPEIKEIEPEPVPPIERTETVEPQNTETQAAQSEQMPQPKTVTQTAAEPHPAQTQLVQTQPAVAKTTAVQQTVPATTQPQQTQTQPAQQQVQQKQTTTTEISSEPKVASTTALPQQNKQDTTPNVVSEVLSEPAPKTESVQAVDPAPKETTDNTATVPPVTTTQETVEQPQTKPVTTETIPVKQRELTEEEKWAAAFGAGLFDDEGFTSNQNPTKTNLVNINSADGVTGAAGVATNNTQPTQTNYAGGGRQVDNSSESRNVSEATENIRKAAADGSGSGTQSTTDDSENNPSTTNKGIVWEGGQRNPKGKLEIEYSDDIIKKIETKLICSISFTVTEAGDIPIGSIIITPPLPSGEITMYIQQYISSHWSFDPRDFTSTATIKNYTIDVKSRR